MNIKMIQNMRGLKRDDVIEDWQQTLAEIVAATGSDSAAVFAIHSESFESSIAAHYNLDSKRFEETVPKLRYSPVGDIARHNQEIVTAQASKEAAKHRYLLRLVSYESCIGVPVPVEGEPRHYLFVFSLKPGHFDSQERYALVKYAAAKMARALQTWQTGEILKDYAPMKIHRAIMGALFHEMRTLAVSSATTVDVLQYSVERGHSEHISERLERLSRLCINLSDLIALASRAFRDTNESETMQAIEIRRVVSALPVILYLHNNEIAVEVQIDEDVSLLVAPWFFRELLSAVLLYGGRNADHRSRIVIRHERKAYQQRGNPEKPES